MTEVKDDLCGRRLGVRSRFFFWALQGVLGYKGRRGYRDMILWDGNGFTPHNVGVKLPGSLLFRRSTVVNS